jgi:uncharacterized membrane protein
MTDLLPSDEFAESMAHVSATTLHPFTVALDTFGSAAAGVIGFIGVMVIVIGAVRASLFFLQYAALGRGRFSHIRIDLGKHLALGLEFFIGKDIIESVMHPTWDALGKLGAIIVLRTVITLLLAREIREIEQEVEEEVKVEREETELSKLQGGSFVTSYASRAGRHIAGLLGRLRLR